jgi:hypothetical protein
MLRAFFNSEVPGVVQGTPVSYCDIVLRKIMTTDGRSLLFTTFGFHCDFNLYLVVRVVQLVKEVTMRLGYRINDVLKVSFKSCDDRCIDLSLRHHIQRFAIYYDI